MIGVNELVFIYVYHGESYKDVKNNNIVLNVIEYLELLKEEGLIEYIENVIGYNTDKNMEMGGILWE